MKTLLYTLQAITAVTVLLSLYGSAVSPSYGRRTVFQNGKGESQEDRDGADDNHESSSFGKDHGTIIILPFLKNVIFTLIF